MSVMVRSASTSQTGFLGTFPTFYKRASRTSLNIGPITDQIRDVLVEFDGLQLDELIESRPSGRPDGYPVDEVAAVEFVRDVLRVTQDQVLAAVDVAERTFFGWKQHGRRPRKSSTGRLWAAVEVLFYLREAHPNIAGWFQRNEVAQQLFRSGEFDAIAELELDWALHTYERPSRPVPEFIEDSLAPLATTHGDDDDEAPVRRRRPAPVATSRLSAHTRDDD